MHRTPCLACSASVNHIPLHQVLANKTLQNQGCHTGMDKLGKSYKYSLAML